MNINQIIDKYQISYVQCYFLKNKIKKELGFCYWKNVAIFLEDRLNIKLLVQDILSTKQPKDISFLFDGNYRKSYFFYQRVYNSNLTITDRTYDLYMNIINKFSEE